MPRMSLKALFSGRIWLSLVLSFFVASQLYGQTQSTSPGDLYELINVEGNLYLAGVRGPGGHTTALLITPDGVIMGDHNDGFALFVEVVENDEHFFFGGGVEVAGGFVGKNHERFVD